MVISMGLQLNRGKRQPFNSHTIIECCAAQRPWLTSAPDGRGPMWLARVDAEKVAGVSQPDAIGTGALRGNVANRDVGLRPCPVPL
jgi:hypothetical protein